MSGELKKLACERRLAVENKSNWNGLWKSHRVCGKEFQESIGKNISNDFRTFSKVSLNFHCKFLNYLRQVETANCFESTWKTSRQTRFHGEFLCNRSSWWLKFEAIFEAWSWSLEIAKHFAITVATKSFVKLRSSLNCCEMFFTFLSNTHLEQEQSLLSVPNLSYHRR